MFCSLTKNSIVFFAKRENVCCLLQRSVGADRFHLKRGSEEAAFVEKVGNKMSGQAKKSQWIQPQLLFILDQIKQEIAWRAIRSFDGLKCSYGWALF